MEKKTVRTGIVGAGFSATFHFEALRKVYGTNVEVIGVYAEPIENAQRYAKERGIRCFDSIDTMLDEVDVVHVCPPPAFHEKYSAAAPERDLAALKELGAADDILLTTCAKILQRAHEGLTQRAATGSDFAVRRLEMTRKSLITTYRQVRARLSRQARKE